MIQSDLNGRCPGIGYIYWSAIFINRTTVSPFKAMIKGISAKVDDKYDSPDILTYFRNSMGIKYIGVFYWPALLQLSPALSVISPSYKDLLSGFKWRLFAADKLGEEGGTLKRNAFCVSSLLTSAATSTAVQSHNWRRWWFFYFFHSISGNLVRRETVTLILVQIWGLYHNFLEKKPSFDKV